MKKIGYWHSRDEPHLPHPEATDIPVEPAFLEKLEEIIKNPETARIQYLGYSTCRLCSKSDNGDSDIFLGEYNFPDGLLHYYKVHNVRPDPDFVKYIMSWNYQFVQIPGQCQLPKMAVNLRKLYELDRLLSGTACLRYSN